MSENCPVAYSLIADSDIAQMQLDYRLSPAAPTAGGQARYHIEIIQKGGKGDDHASALITCDRKSALDFLCMLVSNQALPISLHDILDDWAVA